MEDGVPYAIDFLNPAPDADIHSVGQENFDWIVNAVAEMAVKKALSDENPVQELRWASFLAGGKPTEAPKAKAPAEEKSQRPEPLQATEFARRETRALRVCLSGLLY